MKSIVKAASCSTNGTASEPAMRMAAAKPATMPISTGLAFEFIGLAVLSIQSNEAVRGFS